MSVSQQLRGEIWPLGSSTRSCTFSQMADGTILLSESLNISEARAYVISKTGRKYCLGDYMVNNGRGTKIKEFDSNADVFTALPGSSKLDSVSTKRLNSLLQRSKGVEVVLKQNNSIVKAKSSPLEAGSSAGFFICTAEENFFQPNETLVGTLELHGMIYVFKTFILDKEGADIALSLPKDYGRIGRRISGRESRNVTLSLNGTNYSVKNISLSGMCIDSPDLRSLELWTELKFEQNVGDGPSVPIYACVVGHSESGIHFQFGSGPEVKDRFYFLHSLIHGGNVLTENPEGVYECLSKFGYLEKLDVRIQERTLKVCLSQWKLYKLSPNIINPTLSVDGQLKGTYGAFRASSNNWYHHLLAMDLAPKSLENAVVLYQAWPSYLSTLNSAEYLSAWYNPSKTWHNRFCQIFIKEHEQHPECISFDRHWFWIPPDFKFSEGGPNCTINLVPFSEVDVRQYEECEKILKARYRLSGNVPIIPLIRKSSLEFSNGDIENGFVVKSDERIFGVLFHCQSEIDANPISISNALHLNVFQDAANKLSLEELQNVFDSVIAAMLEKFESCQALTVDFDFPINRIDARGLMYFEIVRCLSFSSRLLNDWLSNNSLAFADLLERANA